MTGPDKGPSPHAKAETHLAALGPPWAFLIGHVGPCLWQPTPCEPYEALIQAVANQQIHGRAAAAVLGRLMKLFPQGPFPSPQQILGQERESIRRCGFSERKVDTILGICQAAERGLVPSFAQASGMEDEELTERLVAIKGIGRWTVDMLLMFTLGREDVLAVDDLGLRKGHQRMQGLLAMPTAKELRQAGEAWRPHRSVASWYLWRANEGAFRPPAV